MKTCRAPHLPATLGAIAVLLLANVQAATAQDAEKVFRDARGYTVRIRTQITTPFITDRLGSCEGAGFLVDAARGWIVTNAHVVGQSPSEVQVAFAGEPFQPARKVYVDGFVDVAVIAVDKISKGRKAAVLDCSDDVSVGEAIGAFGHPLGMYFTGTRGIVSGKTDQFGIDLLQIDATVDHGNSGGPTIALRDGRVVGIATAGMGGDKSDRLNFATPMKDVGHILDLLRQGITPSAPFMQIGLLRDETGSHSLEVGSSFDSQRWPLLPGDRILGIAGEQTDMHTLGELVSALRGRSGTVQLKVERDGHPVTVAITPAASPLVTDERGVSVDGALFSPMVFEDEVSVRETHCLYIQSIEPGSAAEALGLQTADILHMVDGRRIGDLDSLSSYLSARPAGHEIKVVFRRMSPFTHRWFDYLVRQMPGESVHMVEPATALVAQKH